MRRITSFSCSSLALLLPSALPFSSNCPQKKLGRGEFPYLCIGRSAGCAPRNDASMLREKKSMVQRNGNIREGVGSRRASRPLHFHPCGLSNSQPSMKF